VTRSSPVLLAACFVAACGTDDAPQTCALEPVWFEVLDVPTDLAAVRLLGDAAIVQLRDTLARIEPGGARWQRTFASTIVHDFAVSETAIVLLAEWDGTLPDDFGCLRPRELCLVQLDASTGGTVSSKTFPSAFSGHIAMDAAFNLVIAARHSSAIDFGGGPIGPGGTLVGLDQVGQHRYSVSLGAELWFHDVAVHQPSNEVLLAFGTIDAVHVSRFWPNGSSIWDATFSDCGDTTCDIGWVDSDAEGHVYLGGTSSLVSPEFGANKYLEGAFAVKLTPSGDHVWTRSYTYENRYTQHEGFGVNAAGHVISARLSRKLLEDGSAAMHATRELTCLSSDGNVLDAREYQNELISEWADFERVKVDVRPDGRFAFAARSAFPVDLGLGVYHGTIVVGVMRATE